MAFWGGGGGGRCRERGRGVGGRAAASTAAAPAKKALVLRRAPLTVHTHTSSRSHPRAAYCARALSSLSITAKFSQIRARNRKRRETHALTNTSRLQTRCLDRTGRRRLLPSPQPSFLPPPLLLPSATVAAPHRPTASRRLETSRWRPRSRKMAEATTGMRLRRWTRPDEKEKEEEEG
jgi:hypothetical protein